MTDREVLLERLKKAREAKVAKKAERDAAAASAVAAVPAVDAVVAPVEPAPVIDEPAPVAEKPKTKHVKAVKAVPVVDSESSDDDDEQTQHPTKRTGKYKSQYNRLLQRHESLLEAVSGSLVKALAGNATQIPTAPAPVAVATKPSAATTKDAMQQAAKEQLMRATMRKLFG